MITDVEIDELLAQRLDEYYAGKKETDIVNDLQKKYATETWTEAEFTKLFSIHVFKKPLAHVVRRKDGIRGTVAYIDKPRVYFMFIPDNYATPL